ncbi:hypothetical protein TNCT_178501 [Trichonephila clavata]|uniref:Uncharacterized protein n=1 Tax=Trichonephila clavata TaxID=2740835 RepID=A0A8X6H165_TRICU|nr:hypothetical protein TNCT_178501 [Trichonephila clavata]
MEDILNSYKLELLYNESDIPTYLHYNGTGTTRDLTLASADISNVVEREVIYDPGSGLGKIVTTFNFNTKKSLGNSVWHGWNFTKANWNAFTLDLESIFGFLLVSVKKARVLIARFLDLQKLFSVPQKSGYQEASNLNLNFSGMKILPFLRKNLLWLVLLWNIPKRPRIFINIKFFKKNIY